MIANEHVEKACAEVCMYSDELMAAEFDRFFQQQPAICDFVVTATSESPPQVQELSLFLSYMVFKTMESSRAGITLVTPENVEAAHRDSELWIDRMSRIPAEGVDPQDWVDLVRDEEPYLVQYVISELSQPLDSGAPLEDEEKGEIFFVLRTVISSFARRPLGSEAES
jgi:hypothetical protein